LNTYREIYQYKIMATDSCGNLSLDNSEIHQPVRLIATAMNEAIQLNWSPYLGLAVKQYDILKNGTYLTSVGPAVTSFIDTNVICTQTEEYFIRTISANNESSASNTDSMRPYDTKPPRVPYLITATVSVPNEVATIEWAKPKNIDVAGYKVYRLRAGGGQGEMIRETGNPDDTTFRDTVNLASESFCYRVSAFDVCGNISSLSNYGCIIGLTGTPGQLVNKITWPPYQAWKGGVKGYNVYRMDNGMWTLLGITGSAVREYEDKELPDSGGSFCYMVEAVEGSGSFDAVSASTVTCMAQPPLVWMPNIFTPGDDLVNDVFGPAGNYIKSYEMKIFNRWGQCVYQTAESKPWNGVIKGGKVPEGVYVYQLTVEGYDAQKYYLKGFVSILW
jgi:gliding motility-associated-like protein